MMTIEFRDLTADEIECRVNACTAKGCSLLLYKDARCDMNILDETVGAFGWQRDHKELKGVIYCGVGILGAEGWVWKWDAGSESYTEKEKGEASDSFKRACFNWGIGRELYTAPFIWIPSDKVKLEEKSGKWTTKDRFYVNSIVIQKKVIVTLTILDKSGNVVYRYGADDNESGKDLSELTELATEAQLKTIIMLCKKHRIDVDELFKSNNLDAETLTQANANKILKTFQAKYGK